MRSPAAARSSFLPSPEGGEGQSRTSADGEPVAVKRNSVVNIKKYGMLARRVSKLALRCKDAYCRNQSALRDFGVAKTPTAGTKAAFKTRWQCVDVLCLRPICSGLHLSVYVWRAPAGVTQEEGKHWACFFLSTAFLLRCLSFESLHRKGISSPAPPRVANNSLCSAFNGKLFKLGPSKRTQNFQSLAVLQTGRSKRSRETGTRQTTDPVSTLAASIADSTP